MLAGSTTPPGLAVDSSSAGDLGQPRRTPLPRERDENKLKIGITSMKVDNVMHINRADLAM